MMDCHREKVRAARQRVAVTLAQFRDDGSGDRLAQLKVAIENWHSMVGAWAEADTIKPAKQNIS